MVNDAMMQKFRGRYEELYGNLVNKYGPIGQPIARQAPAPKSAGGFGGHAAKARGRGGPTTGKASVDDFGDEFADMVARAGPSGGQLGPSSASAPRAAPAMLLPPLTALRCAQRRGIFEWLTPRLRTPRTGSRLPASPSARGSGRRSDTSARAEPTTWSALCRGSAAGRGLSIVRPAPARWERLLRLTRRCTLRARADVVVWRLIGH